VRKVEERNLSYCVKTETTTILLEGWGLVDRSRMSAVGNRIKTRAESDRVDRILNIPIRHQEDRKMKADRRGKGNGFETNI
jgi:hypothetical protein